MIPLIVEGETVGSLELDTNEPRQFSDEEINLALSVASQVSGVLARIRLDEERHQLEAQYYQAQKMEALGRLTGGVAHDFNNILTVILGHAEVMLEALGPGHALHDDMGEIRKAAERAASLTHQLLAFSHQQVLQPKELALNDIVADIEKMLRRLIGEDIDLATVLEPQLGLVKADPGQIEQVILNLAVNARDAMPQGGKLTIETANVYVDAGYASQHVDVVSGFRGADGFILLAVNCRCE